MRLGLSSFSSSPPKQERAITRLKIHVDDPLFIAKMGKTVAQTLQELNPQLRNPTVLVCIGTDRSTGDCLGPLVGSRLMAHGLSHFQVFGTLENPVHATNLSSTLEMIQDKFPTSLVIGLDACLGSVNSVGYVSFGDGALNPGAGVHKNLPPVGQVHISGVVNVGGFMEYLVLQNTRLSMVMKMAEKISLGLISGQALAAASL